MKIDRNNYEVFIIDFFDGKLNAEDTSALMLFLDSNPDLKEEFEILKEPLPKPEPIVFEKKGTLKKQAVKVVADIKEDNYENFFIGFYEGDLNNQEKEDLKIFLGLNNFLEEEFKVFGKVYLQVDTSIYFPDKESLKMKPKHRIAYYSISVAAIILLFFSLYPFLKTEIPSSSFNEKAQLSVMQNANPVLKINKPVDHQLIVSDNKPKPIQLVNEITEESESQMLTFVEAKEIPLDDLLSMNYSLGKKNDYILVPEFPEETEKEKKSAFGRVLDKNIGGLLAVFKSKKSKSEKNSEPVFVKVLDQSLLVFNTITGSDKELTKVYSKEGKLKSYGFSGGAINVNRKLARQRDYKGN